MTDSPRSSRAKAPAPPPTVAQPSSLSPLAQLLPTGPRDIQPFQKGRGWHTNGPVVGKGVRRLRGSADSSVVFPAISSLDAQRRDGDERQERSEDAADRSMIVGLHSPVASSSPSVTAIPVPPSAPRRPSRGDNNERHTASPRFRTRAIATAAAASVSPSHNGSLGPSGSVDELPSNGGSEDAMVPDPDVVAKLWQEYAERTKPRAIDGDAYHRKMQHKYTELKAMRERIVRLESELVDTQRERDDAREAAARSTQLSAVAKRHDLETTDELGHLQQQLSTVSASRPGFKPMQAMMPDEVSYREKAFKLERALAAMKDAMTETHTQLTLQHDRDRDTIRVLTAKLLLEQEANQLLARQLLEANAAFQATTESLVATQIDLEREQIHKKIVLEQIQQQTHELVSDHRRKELQNRVRNVIRTLGKDALHHKMEALHTRALVAEQSMRKAELQVANLQAEATAQQLQLEQILSSSALKYHSLAADGGVPGILDRASALFSGARVVTSQLLMIQILYEDERSGTGDTDTVDVDVFGNESFRLHFICYEAQTAQDDFLTFQLRDIQRLVPDHETYLAGYTDRKRERLLALAEILFGHLHAGYKNGHLVITEVPVTALESVAGGGSSSEQREVGLLRTTRLLRVSGGDEGSAPTDGSVLAEILVNEVYDASTSDLWWLEIRAVVLDSEGVPDTQCDPEYATIVDQQLLRTTCMHLGSYRPSETIATGHQEGTDANVVVGVHGELLEPLLSKLIFKAARGTRDNQESEDVAVQLQLVVDLPNDTALSSDRSAVQMEDSRALVQEEDEELQSASAIPHQGLWDTHGSSDSVLDHRCILRIGDIFYCVRIQEVWDAELMLEIAMEEPETQSKFHLVVSESDIVAITRYLFSDGRVDEDCATQVKDGLPFKLHAPVCKLLKKHLAPVTDSSSSSQSRASGIGTISIASLMGHIYPQAPFLPESTRLLESAQACGDNVVAKSWLLEPLENDLPSHYVDRAAAQLTARACNPNARDARLHRIRRGCRVFSKQADDASHMLVDVWTGFEGFDGLVLEFWSISASSWIQIDGSRCFITLQSMEEAFKALALLVLPSCNPVS